MGQAAGDRVIDYRFACFAKMTEGENGRSSVPLRMVLVIQGVGGLGFDGWLLA